MYDRERPANTGAPGGESDGQKNCARRAARAAKNAENRFVKWRSFRREDHKCQGIGRSLHTGRGRKARLRQHRLAEGARGSGLAFAGLRVLVVVMAEDMGQDMQLQDQQTGQC